VTQTSAQETLVVAVFVGESYLPFLFAPFPSSCGEIVEQTFPPTHIIGRTKVSDRKSCLRKTAKPHIAITASTSTLLHPSLQFLRLCEGQACLERHRAKKRGEKVWRAERSGRGEIVRVGLRVSRRAERKRVGPSGPLQKNAYGLLPHGRAEKVAGHSLLKAI